MSVDLNENFCGISDKKGQGIDLENIGENELCNDETKEPKENIEQQQHAKNDPEALKEVKNRLSKIQKRKRKTFTGKKIKHFSATRSKSLPSSPLSKSIPSSPSNDSPKSLRHYRIPTDAVNDSKRVYGMTKQHDSENNTGK